jgi:hypothetical protein
MAVQNHLDVADLDYAEAASRHGTRGAAGNVSAGHLSTSARYSRQPPGPTPPSDRPECGLAHSGLIPLHWA